MRRQRTNFVQGRQLLGHKPLEEVGGHHGANPRFVECFGGVLREDLSVMLQSAGEQRIGAPFRSPCRSPVNDKRTPADLEAGSPSFGDYSSHVGMNRKVNTGCLDPTRLRVRFSDRTDDAISHHVVESQANQIDAAQCEMKAERHQPLQP
jgi:hypothetical protein